MLQRLFDWLVPVNERSKEYEETRSLGFRERGDYFKTRQREQLLKELYDTEDGIRAGRVVTRQRLEDGRSPFRAKPNLTAWEQAKQAREEDEAENREWQEAFRDFDKENSENHIQRVRSKLEKLVGRHQEEFEDPDEDPKPSRFPNWEEINKTPARGFTNPENGRSPYRQMVLMKESEAPLQVIHEEPIGLRQESKPILKEQPQEEPEEEAPDEKLTLADTDWNAVNESARAVSSAEEAQNKGNAAFLNDKNEEAEFWWSLAKEIEDELPDEDEDDDPGE